MSFLREISVVAGDEKEAGGRALAVSTQDWPVGWFCSTGRDGTGWLTRRGGTEQISTGHWKILDCCDLS